MVRDVDEGGCGGDIGDASGHCARYEIVLKRTDLKFI